MNKNFKKILSGALACTIVLSAAMPALAATNYQLIEDCVVTDLDVDIAAKAIGTQDIKLYGTEAPEIEDSLEDKVNHESTPKIYVEVTWDELLFKYDFGKVVDYDWNINDLTYDSVYEYTYNENGESWNKDHVTFTFKNLSNRDVWTAVYFEKNQFTDIYDDVTLTPDHEKVQLQSAVGKTDKTVDVKDIKLYIDGRPERTERYDFNDLPNLGTVRFGISEYVKVTTPDDPNPNDPHKHVYKSVKEFDEDYLIELTGNSDPYHYCRVCEECGELIEHHFVYDQFGRLVCTGCDSVKHEYCIDEDEDGLCDECGMERDFCPDCHVGGTCRCT